MSWPGREEFRLAWTFFTHEEAHVCILLGLCKSKEFTYERVLTNCIQVLEKANHPFTPSSLEQVYLPPFYEISIPRICGDFLSFKLYPHSTAESVLSVVDVYPNIGLQCPQPGLHTRILSLLECPNKLAVLINIHEFDTDTKIIAIFKIFGRNWRCTFRKHSEVTSLQQLVESRQLMQGQDDLSDRAIIALPNRSDLAAATKSRQLTYLAHITLLQRKLALVSQNG